MQKFPMTAPGLQRLNDELRQLKASERPAIIRQIAEARTHGDLSENAEYHAARERQSFIEGRIAELEEIVSSVEVIDPSTLSGEHIMFGAHVRLVEEETEKESSYQIVVVHDQQLRILRVPQTLRDCLAFLRPHGAPQEEKRCNKNRQKKCHPARSHMGSPR